MLEGKHVRLRQIEEADLPKLRDLRNAPHIRAYTREYRPLNMLNQNEWLSSFLTDKTNIMFIIEKLDSSEAIGCCGLTYTNWKEGHEDLLKYGFCELRLHRVYAIIFEYNEASIKFFEKNGFKFEGKHREARFWDGKFYDEMVYGVLEHEYLEEHI